MWQQISGNNLRQLLYSTVITNNGKNSKKALDKLSRVVQRHSSTSQAALDSPNGSSLDWMKNLYGTDNERLGSKIDPSWWYTGQQPNSATLKVISNHEGHVSCLPQINLTSTTKDMVQRYFDNSWLMTEVLFSGLEGEEAFYRPPYHHLRHPMIFYYGHPATFYINKLRVAGLIEDGINPHFEELFEVGVDEMRWDDISTLSKSWPRVSEVHEYRQEAYKIVCSVIDQEYQRTPMISITQESPLWALMMGVEHEKIHLETSSVLMRELPIDLVVPPKYFPSVHPMVRNIEREINPESGVDYPVNELLPVSGAKIQVGKTNETEFAIYGWDNEYGSKQVDVESFECSKFKVSNGEFLEFVKAGGYREREFWTDDGWNWRCFGNHKWPPFWEKLGPEGSHIYSIRHIFEEAEMPWSAPVCVNYHEASAFCKWKQQDLGLEDELRLITEAEHHCLRDDDLQLPLRPGGLEKDLAVSRGACQEINNHLAHGSEGPVDKNKNGKGFYDVQGNVWEWTEDYFHPLPGFEPHVFYDDFSTPCFDGEHTLIMGGSFISCSGNGGNIFSRFHFRSHFHQHAGFRYVKNCREGTSTLQDQEPEKTVRNIEKSENTYETTKLLDQYLALHFGQQDSNVNFTIRKHNDRPDHALDFTARSAGMLIDIFKRGNLFKENKPTRALDVGCAVGAATFKLAESFDEAIGVDYSAAFVNQANEIQKMPDGATLKFKVPVQGDIMRSGVTASIPPKNVRDRASFLVGDGTNLPDLQLGTFDAILCANLLCRLPDPKILLNDLNSLMNQDGVALFLSPYSWLEEFTEKDKWLLDSDRMSADVLKTTMANNGFTVVHEEDVPLIIREHERKYQYIISHALAFRKK